MHPLQPRAEDSQICSRRQLDLQQKTARSAAEDSQICSRRQLHLQQKTARSAAEDSYICSRRQLHLQQKTARSAAEDSWVCCRRQINLQPKAAGSPAALVVWLGISFFFFFAPVLPFITNTRDGPGKEDRVPAAGTLDMPQPSLTSMGLWGDSWSQAFIR